MSTAGYRLYDFPFSGNGYKIRLALTQLGLAFDYISLDILAGETRTPEFLALEEGAFALGAYPNVTRWLKAIKAQSGHIPIDAHV